LKEPGIEKTPHRGAGDVNGIPEFNSHATFPTPLETGAATPASSTCRVSRCSHGCPWPCGTKGWMAKDFAEQFMEMVKPKNYDPAQRTGF
ncbi:MAG: hypothetical protein WCS27_08455, partial [Victivallaceae bacterium]